MRIAVVGGGVSGLGAAWALRHDHDVTIFESDDRLGGHANTRPAADDGRELAIDTGFIVHNRRRYPELVALFDELGIETQATEMSLSIECRECGIQYAGRRPRSLVIGVLRRPRLLGLLREITRFMRRASADLAAGIDDDVTLDEWARDVGLSKRLVSHFLLPLTAAVWSAPPGRALDMPAGYILAFLDNHGMLTPRRLAWRTVRGGSRAYVSRMQAELEGCGVVVRCTTPVRSISRDGAGAVLTLDGPASEAFDAVVVATHADHSLALLADAGELERELLQPWHFTRNEAVLHDDVSLLPSQRSARAGWNYRLASCSGEGALPTVSYYMNRLQRLRATGHWSVTLNGADAVDPARVQYRTTYRHPRFDTSAVAAQRRMGELDACADRTRTVFCGAWRGFGFHEDGLRSGLEAGRVLAALALRQGSTP